MLRLLFMVSSSVSKKIPYFFFKMYSPILKPVSKFLLGALLTQGFLLVLGPQVAVGLDTDSPRSFHLAKTIDSVETSGDKTISKNIDTPSTKQLPGRPSPQDGFLPEENFGRYTRNNFIPIRDRWRIGYTGTWYDPYNQNILKADYPVWGTQNLFVNILAISDTLFEARNLPTPKGISRAEPGSAGGFFGRGRQLFLNQNFIFSFELFTGATGFRPKDWSVRISPVFNINYLDVRELGVVNIDVREGTTRTDGQVALQEAFVEKKLLDMTSRFDFISVRAGIQGFTSDFRGFIFADNEPGIRFFGNFDNNLYQWNAAYFYFLEKDTNSQLNTLNARNRHLIVANLYMQDFIWLGYTTQFSVHYDRDDAGKNDPGNQQFDTNGFLVRPARVGDVAPHNLEVYYFGWTGDGHIGRMNISHAFYQVFGRDDNEPISGKAADINAQMAAAELSVDIDWYRPKFSIFFASGDGNPRDDKARAFDSILDNVNFAGNGFSFFNRQEIRLTQTGLQLTGRLSLLPNLRSSKIQGQSQFVNPGLFLLNPGVDIEVTPKLRALLNANFLWFVYTEPLEVVLQQPNIRHFMGQDYSLGLIYRPLLNNNIILSMQAAVFQPGGGFVDAQVNNTLYSTFFSLTLTY